MSFEDALRIVRGHGHEATDYLHQNAGPKLDTLFRPIVGQQLDKVGTTRCCPTIGRKSVSRSEEHTSELQSLAYLVCRLLLEKKKNTRTVRSQYVHRRHLDA